MSDDALREQIEAQPYGYAAGYEAGFRAGLRRSEPQSVLTPEQRGIVRGVAERLSSQAAQRREMAELSTWPNAQFAQAERLQREAEALLVMLRRSEPQPVRTEWRFCQDCGAVEHHHRAEHAFIPDPAKTIPLAEPQPAPSQPTCEHGNGAGCTIPVWGEYHGQYSPCPGPPRSSEPSAEGGP